MKTRVRGNVVAGMAALFAALAVGTLALAGCGADTDDGDTQKPEKYGTVNVTLNAPAGAADTGSSTLGSALSLSLDGSIPTLLPDRSGWVYSLTFENLDGLYTHDAESVAAGTMSEIRLEPGVWVISGHAKNAGVEVGCGSTTVVVAAGAVTSASTILGPLTGAGAAFDGYLDYSITLPPGVSGALTLEATSGSMGEIGKVNLAEGENHTELSMTAGTYLLVASLSGPDGSAGKVEAIHVYRGLTTYFTWEPDLIDSAPLEESDYDLTPYIPAPVEDAVISPAVINDAPHYTGVILWTTADGQSVGGSTFALGTTYKAEVVLTALGGYTFAGTEANAFRHHGAASVTNPAGTGIVTIVFPPTGDGSDSGGVDITIGFNDEEIEIIGGDGENIIYKTEEPKTLSLESPLYSNVRWYVEAEQVTRNLSENNRKVIIDAAYYAVGKHTLTFVGMKNERFYSQALPFEVRQDREGDSPTVTTVTVSPASSTAVRGESQTFRATVTGTGNPVKKVTWSIEESGKNADTAITSNGVLTVAEEETLSTLTVRATSTADTSKYGRATVSVTRPEETICEVALYLLGGTLYWEGGTYNLQNPLTVTRLAGAAYGDILDSVPVRPNFVFIGWWTKINGLGEVSGDKVTADDIVTGDIGLCAGWTPAIYNVTFDANGGTPASTSTTVKFGTSIGTLPEVTRTGFMFDGWYTPDGGTKLTSNNFLVTDDITFYAHWTAVIYTITFDANYSGAPEPEIRTGRYGETYGFYGALPVLTRTGYTFDGWFTAASGGSQVWATTIGNQMEDHTLYAHWTAKTFKVEYSSVDGYVVFKDGYSYEKTVTYDDVYGTLWGEEAFSYIPPNMNFDGWWSEPTGGEEVFAETPVTRADDHQIYVHWVQNLTPDVPVTSVTFDPPTYTLEVGRYGRYEPVVLPANASKKTLTWSSSDTSVATVSASGQVTALHTGTAVITAAATDRGGIVSGSYTLTVGISVMFNANNGTVSTLADVVVTGAAYGTLPTPSRSGCDFKGWYTAASGGTEVTAATTVTATETHTLYAHWWAQNMTADPSYIRLWNAWDAGSSQYNTHPQSATFSILSDPPDAERYPLASGSISGGAGWITVEISPNATSGQLYLNNNWAVYRGGTAIIPFSVTFKATNNATVTFTGEIWGISDGT